MKIHDRIATSFNEQGLMATIGAKLVLVSDGEVHMELPHSMALSQQRGYVHAGAITAIVDSATIVNVRHDAYPGSRGAQ